MRALLFVLILLLSTGVDAADTVEPFDPGATDLEFYALVSGVDRHRSAQTVAGDMVLGWGLVPGFSAYLATTMQADGTFTGSETDLAVGVFGTIRDGRRLDIDLALAFQAPSHGDGPLTLSPGLEINLDGDGRGLYARGNLSLAGRHADDGPRRTTDLEATLGGYLDLGQRYQLLLELGAVRADGEESWTTGAAALGLNTVLSPSLELIAQVSRDIHEPRGPASLGAMLGFIATLPGDQPRP